MAIYGIGAYSNLTGDVSGRFLKEKLVGVGWSITEAPELHQFMASLKVGDIVYIKSFPPGSQTILVRAIGVVADDKIRNEKAIKDLVKCGRNVVWKVTKGFEIPKPDEKNNVRLNTVYQEFHPKVQSEIIRKLLK